MSNNEEIYESGRVPLSATAENPMPMAMERLTHSEDSNCSDEGNPLEDALDSSARANNDGSNTSREGNHSKDANYKTTCSLDHSDTISENSQTMDPVLLKLVQERATKNDHPDEEAARCPFPSAPVERTIKGSAAASQVGMEGQRPGAFPVEPRGNETSLFPASGHSSTTSIWSVSSGGGGSIEESKAEDGDPQVELLPIAAEVVDDVDMEKEIQRRVEQEVSRISMRSLQVEQEVSRRSLRSLQASEPESSSSTEERQSSELQDMFGATATWRSGEARDHAMNVSVHSTGSEDIRRITRVLKRTGSTGSSHSNEEIQSLAKNIRAALKRGNSFKSVDYESPRTTGPKWKMLFCCFVGSKKEDDENDLDAFP